jgi:phage terminase large subunit
MKNHKVEELQLDVTPVFDKNFEAYTKGYRFIVNQGGSRSSKTYSLCQLLLYLALCAPLSISVVRKSLPSLKSSVMKDFFEVLKYHNIYNEQYHNKTENSYSLGNGSEIHFFSVDDEQKIRGRKHNILFLNEANELTFEIFNQLVLRCSGEVFLDFNPSDSEHWIYDLLADQKQKSILIKSTYKDNPFLPKDQIDYIENLINVDHNYYLVYALGERPVSETRIYSHFKKFVDVPEYQSGVCFGLDIGFNHPTSLVKTFFSGSKVYVQELVYESKLTTPDLIGKMNALLSDSERLKTIYVDSARPDVIEELNRAGFKAEPASKNVKDGITYIKSLEVYLHIDSLNLWKESKLYSWQSKGNIILDEPIKLNDDGMDSIRYSLYSSRRIGSDKFDYQWTFI